MRSRVLPVVVWLSLAASATGVGLTTVSAVRGVVADEPVRVLSASEVEDLLHEPDADLDPIATLTASSSVPRGASRNDDEGRQVDSREAMAQSEADRSNVPTNADDRPSRLGSDPGTLAGTRGGPARTTRKTGLSTDVIEPSGGNPRAPQPIVSPTPSGTEPPSAEPSETPSETSSSTPSTSPSMTPSGEATSGTPTPSPSPSAPSPTPSGPAPSPTPPASASPTVTRTPTPTPTTATPTPTPTPTPTATRSGPASSTSPGIATPTPVRTPAATATRPPLRFVMRSASTGWGLLLPSR